MGNNSICSRARVGTLIVKSQKGSGCRGLDGHPLPTPCLRFAINLIPFLVALFVLCLLCVINLLVGRREDRQAHVQWNSKDEIEPGLCQL